MAKIITRTISIQLFTNPVGAGFDPDAVLTHFWQRLEKRLLKRGWQGVRVGDAQPADVVLRLDLKPGNRMLRYLVPFSSPAIVTAIGTVMRPDGSPSHQVQARGTAHFGMLGGSPSGMLKVSADRAAASIAKQLGSAPARAFEPIMPMRE